MRYKRLSAPRVGRLGPELQSQNGSYSQPAGIIQSSALKDKGQPTCQVTVPPALSYLPLTGNSLQCNAGQFMPSGGTFGHLESSFSLSWNLSFMTSIRQCYPSPVSNICRQLSFPPWNLISLGLHTSKCLPFGRTPSLESPCFPFLSL